MASHIDSTDSTPMLASDASTSVPSATVPSAGDAVPAIPAAAIPVPAIPVPAIPVPAIPIPFAPALDSGSQKERIACAPGYFRPQFSMPNKRPRQQKRSAAQVSAGALNLQSSTPAHTKALIDFMRQLHLERYTLELINQGYDDLNFMSTQSKKELQGVAALVNMLPGHAAKFVAALTRNVNAMLRIISGKAASATSGKPTDASATSGKAASGSASDKSYVACIVDRSGSMRSMGMAVKTGFNEFLQEQKAFPGDCVATVVKFDHEVEVVHHGVNLSTIPAATNATFEPRGRTALYDAIGDTIAMVKEKISSLPAKPNRVMVLVLTDGEENGSRKHSHSAIMKTIAHCEKTLKWTFLFIGANQDAIATGRRMGFTPQNCLSYSSDVHHQRATWSNINMNICRQRAGGSANWTDRERNTSLR